MESKNNGQLPQPGNDADAAAFVALVKDEVSAQYKAVEEVDEKLFTTFAKTCRGNISGGHVWWRHRSKSSKRTGKFTPLNQFSSIRANHCRRN